MMVLTNPGVVSIEGSLGMLSPDCGGLRVRELALAVCALASLGASFPVAAQSAATAIARIARAIF